MFREVSCRFQAGYLLKDYSAFSVLFGKVLLADEE